MLPQRPDHDIPVGWIPDPGSKANPLAAWAYSVIARGEVENLGQLVEAAGRWFGGVEQIERQRLRRTAARLVERGLVAMSGERWTVPGDVLARAWRDGVRLRWLADGAGRVSVSAAYLLAYRDQRSNPRLEFAWVDSVERTAEALGMHRDTVGQVEAQLVAAGILGVGAHPAGKGVRRWRSTAGGRGTIRRSKARQYPAQPKGCPTESLAEVRPTGHRTEAGRSDESVAPSPARFAGQVGGSLRSPLLRGTCPGVRTSTGPDPVPTWLVDLERRQVEAQRADVPGGEAVDNVERLRVLRRISSIHFEQDRQTAVLAVLTAAGVYVDQDGDTGPGLRDRRRQLAAQLAQDVEARDLLAWFLVALRAYGKPGERIVGRKDGRHVLRFSGGVRSLGAYFLPTLRAAKGDGWRHPGDALAGVLVNKLKRLVGRHGTPNDVLPERLAEEPFQVGQIFAAVVPEPITPTWLELLGYQFKRAGQQRNMDQALRIVGAAVSEGATASDLVSWPVQGLDRRSAQTLIVSAQQRGYVDPAIAASVQIDADIPKAIAAQIRVAAGRDARMAQLSTVDPGPRRVVDLLRGAGVHSAARDANQPLARRALGGSRSRSLRDPAAASAG